MEEKASGIVLSAVSYGENDKILNIFTVEQGTVSAKIKGVKKAGAKLKFASEPFCFAEFIFLNKNGFRTVIGVSLIDSFYPLREDLKKYYAGATVLEFIKRFAKENIVSPELFMSAINALKEISYGNSTLFPLVSFLTEGLKRAGYALSLGQCYGCGKKELEKVFFDYRTGGFYCEDCAVNGREINPKTYSAFCDIKKGNVLSDADAIFALRLLDYYLCEKTEEKLNSLKELLSIIKDFT